jgi:uncharacterized SAM-dependent methyltransferase
MYIFVTCYDRLLFYYPTRTPAAAAAAAAAAIAVVCRCMVHDGMRVGASLGTV